ncbi:MAG: hypothetical protein AUG51_24240 [Acidobacteria bacterium 13_1_20CM_3_53_8]|nr:MAG: hypothetical protein AUG51_24240 [Acidobacteria bacterium 13_1_20CM_3_53_8]
MERAVKIIWMIAMGILSFTIVPLGFGLRLHVASFIVIGAYALGISLALMLLATLLWAISWIKKNVRVR